MQKTQAKGVIMLLITAFIWGSSFVAQSLGAQTLQAMSFMGIRSIFGGLALLPIILIKELSQKGKLPDKSQSVRKEIIKKSIFSGIPVGLVLCVASCVQQFAFSYTPAGKVAFITAFYMFFVPLFGMLLGKKTPAVLWACIAIGVAGLYYLCIGENGITDINRGDLLAFICSICYAWHILAIEKFEPGCDGIILSCTQFFVAGITALIGGLIFENPTLQDCKTAIFPLLYSGVMSCGVAYTFQILGQKHTEATVASLIMCMESVFGVLSSAVVLKEHLSVREISGCVIMFCAIIISQFADYITQKSQERKHNGKTK